MSRASARLAPSLLAADFADLGGAIRSLEGVVDVFHVDVMDGHFVPNISMGPDAVASLRAVTSAELDVHLMVAEPERWIGPFRDAGADWISFQYEATAHIERTLSQIRESGARAGLALNPGTMPAGLDYVLEEGDLLLVMSVNPGFGGQTFLPRCLDKVVVLRQQLDESGLAAVDIEIDGGIDADNAAACVRAGVNILVAGSSIYGAGDPRRAAERILEQLE